jgi:uncharacterized membrane protein YphA (DoxX/SURF4 family)
MDANNANLVRAVRWPLTLITLGVLFALNNFTDYHFHQTWPVLLIVFGVLSLLGRGVGGTYPSGASGPPSRGPGGPR